MNIYFISICGTGVGNLAILLKKQGHAVRGSEVSEKYFYPPMADLIKNAQIPVTLNFDPEEITKDIDLVIMGGSALIHDSKNPQVEKAKKLGLKLISYAQGIGEFLSKENNIEVVGNHAKTTTTALVAHTLREGCKLDASYFIGGAAIGFEETIYSGQDPWSVCEGDEHPSLGQEPGGKFLYHKPKHVLFTSADWDHKNIYKTEKDYLNVFKELFDKLPEDGVVTACLDGKNVVKILDSSDLKSNKINLYSIGDFKRLDANDEIDPDEVGNHLVKEINEVARSCPKVYKNVENFYFVDEVNYKWKPDATRFRVKVFSTKNNNIVSLGYFSTGLIGQIGIENSLAVIANLHGLGFDTENIRNGIATFKGVQRKLEIIHTKDYIVINDHAHSPIKIESSLHSIRTKFATNKIFVIFHVSQSGLKEENTFRQLQYVFNLADFVIIPRVMPDMEGGNPIFGKDYQSLIKSGTKDAKFLKDTNVYYTPLITQMKSILENNLKRGDVIVIMSSGDVREFVELTRNLTFNT